MPSSNYYQQLINQISNRSAESTMSMLGITDENLRKHLAQSFSRKLDGSSFLAEPVFECMYPWEAGNQSLEDLSGTLLAPSLVEAMDKSGILKKTIHPYKHQVHAWKALLDQKQKKSTVITSGTGSGKTECFMVPIFNDLVGEYERTLEPLVGVRALFIYPLNALINSQRERLDAITKPYDDGIRFCLFNGNTSEYKHKEQSKRPNELLTRKLIRNSPPPVMVTNASMLEYMLVRQVDSPIIEKSQGTLRWIVLDEAHSYIGSQAAELSLLLRRVLHTFGVNASDVRFVATSATIGDDAGQKLAEYLADLAGVDQEQVVVVGGKRVVPKLPDVEKNSLTIEELREIDQGETFSNERYKQLSGNVTASRLRNALASSSHPVGLKKLTDIVFNGTDEKSKQKLLETLDISSFTQKPGKELPYDGAQAFLPVRAHLFHQVINGLWCCADKSCHVKTNSFLSKGWPFGNVYTERKNRCDCGAPVYELVFCTDCNSPYLMTEVTSDNRLIQTTNVSFDEFSLDIESLEDSEGQEESEPIQRVYLAPASHPELTSPNSINPEDLSLQGMGAETLEVNQLEPAYSNSDILSCVTCDNSAKPSPFRQCVLGTPFYISNTVPTLLEGCEETEPASDRPSRGKRLITFTDSRQGTAKISTKIQQDSERNSIRGHVYKVSSSNNDSSTFSTEEQKQLEDFEASLKQLEDVPGVPEEVKANFLTAIEGLINKRDLSQQRAPIAWRDMVTELQSSADVSKWMADYYSTINDSLFGEHGGSRNLAEMLLLKEFARRPKRQNSLETLGMVAVTYPALSKVKAMPDVWASLNLSLEDWKNFLKLTLDFYIRENSILDIPKEWSNWMGAKIFPKTVVRRDSQEEQTNQIKKWPGARGGRSSRLIRMLGLACELDLSDKANQDRINEVMDKAWDVLTKYGLLKSSSNSILFHLDRNQLAFKVIDKAWVCPITSRLLDTAFKGITPYLPFKCQLKDVECRKVSIPVCEMDLSSFTSHQEKVHAFRQWIVNSSEVAELRKNNLWTDISDRIVEGGSFIRVGEHSAQQPADTLKRYESLFKDGKLNVLSCSTTMEMGVDIGGISVVAMNNVPPHPANYLQRAGRAGRRGETQAVAFTICKDNPHERAVFDDPLWPFKTSIASPNIALNSSQIVQRHVNSLLMAYFLKNIIAVSDNKSVINLTCEWFFVADEEDSLESPYEKMSHWLNEISTINVNIPTDLQKGIQNIIKGSVLASKSISSLCNSALLTLNNVANRWIPQYEKLSCQIKELEKVSKRDPFKKKMEFDLKRFGSDYLLSELSTKAFLPAYGFPTGIATFDHYSIHDYKMNKYRSEKNKGRIDNAARMRERPGRDMSVAIREYAPGTDVVIDGLVYKSAGILLNPIAPDDDFGQPVRIMSSWRCHHCGFIDETVASLFDGICPKCDTKLKKEHIKEFIEPQGFAVDFYSSPTTDITRSQYIPVQEPWVTAREELKAVYNPLLGSYRSSSEGHIFHHSSGEHGEGYAVCLKCGKAESMLPDGELPNIFRDGKTHRRLRGKPENDESSVCEGSDNHHAIAPSIYLGSSDQTDIFELYLKDPATNEYLVHKPNNSVLWTLAVALRQALADIHGITADEIGYTVKPTSIKGASASGIVLFDRCGGGAGFSSAATYHLKEMIQSAKKYLDCPDECDSACQSCLLGYDTRYHVNVLNRIKALNFLDSILKFVEIPDSQKLFGEDTKFCLNSLDIEVFRRADNGFNSVTLYLSGSPASWDIISSGVKARIRSWFSKFSQVNVVLSLTELDEISDDLNDELFNLQAIGASIKVTSETDLPIIVLKNEQRVLAYRTTSNESLSVPDENFWDQENQTIVYGPITSEPEAEDHKIESKEVIQLIQGDVEVDISSEVDGPINRLGLSLWSNLMKNNEKLEKLISSGTKIKEITYTDKYICSPWSVVLFKSILMGLKQKLKSLWGQPVATLTTSIKEPSFKAHGLFSEWGDQSSRAEVITQLFKKAGLNLSVNLAEAREMPHSRPLIISWESGDVTIVRFDHGMGHWKPTSYTSFNINRPSDEQVADLLKIYKHISAKQSKPHATQIFIKNR